ncbi:MAG TPA: alpha/beta fold hydrolase [Streptosporangiaceae bacterium]|nr:alpha/beta fold hydrolase [Streptosporangiaceae bacterium]
MKIRTLLAVIMLAGCTGPATTTGSHATAGAPSLHGDHPCPGVAGFTCSTLTVPLDHSGQVPGTLRLNVAAAGNAGAVRGVLLFLAGGPGQPGVSFIGKIAARLAPVLHDYRLVMFDQRGTGGTAIDCPALQAEVGSSDIATPTPGAVRQCADVIGADRRFYSTMDTVADMDMLRAALGVPAMAVDGVSYGTYVAERYALAYPDRVSRLVLDSVVPQADPGRTDAFYLVGLRAVGRVLRLACQAKPVCGFDPAEDVAWLVRHGTDGISVFDMLVTYEFVDPTYRDPDPPRFPPGSGDVIGALHAARLGNPAHLRQLIGALTGGGGPADQFSSGLHAATLCTDMRFPWGPDSVPPGTARSVPLLRATSLLTSADVWPFDATTAERDGFMQTCLYWPATPSAPEAAAVLPRVPVLLLAGDHDLSTPLEWARQELARAPRGKLAVVPGASHSIQTRERGTAGRDAVVAFLMS